MTSKLKTDVLETVSGSGTIALTNQLSGMTSASMPSGSVLQVLGKSVTDMSTTTSTSFVPLSTLNQVITPISTSSKVLVSFSMQLEMTTSAGGYLQINRTVGGVDTPIDVVTRNSITASRTFLSQGYGGFNGQSTSIEFLDSPNTVSEITYSIKWRVSGETAYFNRGVSNTNAPASSSITLMEIKG